MVPEWSQSDPRTAELVHRIRAEAPRLERPAGVADMVVTGQTAVAIDVSTRLAGALVPFGIVVVGLALILLMIVFRSIAVPIKATLGYLLSIMAALGVVSAVFIWGWFNGPLGHHLKWTGGQLHADHRDGGAVRAGHGLRGVPGLGDP